MFSEKAKTIVMFTIDSAETPLSIGDIAFRTGLGYNTVKRVVLGDSRVEKIPGRPATYHAKLTDRQDVLVVSYEKPEGEWQEWLDEIRPLLPSIVAMSDEMSEQERARKIGMFKSLGASFLSLAKDMEEEE